MNDCSDYDYDVEGTLELINAMAKHNPRRVEVINCFCRNCWRRLAISFEWQELEGKTMLDLINMCNDKHRATCDKPDVRNYATKTARR